MDASAGAPSGVYAHGSDSLSLDTVPAVSAPLVLWEKLHSLQAPLGPVRVTLFSTEGPSTAAASHQC